MARGQTAPMHAARSLLGMRILARDGNLGHLEDIHVDDANWAVTHVVVNTGTWLLGRRILLPASVLVGVEWWGVDGLRVDLACREVRDSPALALDEPLADRHGHVGAGFFGWPSFWGGPMEWTEYDRSLGTSHHALHREGAMPITGGTVRSLRQLEHMLLRSGDDVLAHVVDFLVEEEGWYVPALVASLHVVRPGEQVQLPTRTILGVDVDHREVRIDLTEHGIATAPVFDPAATSSRPG